MLSQNWQTPSTRCSTRRWSHFRDVHGESGGLCILFYAIIIHVSYEIPLPIIHPMACHSTHATTRSCCSWFSTFDTHTEPTVAAASNKAIGSAALSSPAPGVASEKAAAPTIRVPRYATTNSSAESARPATVMPATKAHAFSPPSGLGSSLSSM